MMDSDHTEPRRSWFYVVNPDGGTPLTRRTHGYPGRLLVEDHSAAELPLAALLRAASGAGFSLEALEQAGQRPLAVRLGPATTAPHMDPTGPLEVLHVDGPALAALSSEQRVSEQLTRLLRETPPGASLRLPQPVIPPTANRALFFESPMSSELDHNDREISQGVLHLMGALMGSATTPVLAQLKMPGGGANHPISGLDGLTDGLAKTPVQLICLTLLEDYFEAARRLIQVLRERGCKAHIAVGGVMPTLSPEHVAAHLPGVSFVCRGAGERFVRRLAEIVGTSDVTTPLTDDQCWALMAMDGLLAVDHAGRRVIAGNLGCVAEVDDLDAAPVDLSRLEARHIQGGIEISTARGCTHHCSFCSILGRGRYQARSVDSIFELLDQYQARFGELFGADIPPSAFRVHISDDDFACDRHRAAAFLRRVEETRFRLSSLQLSIADLCRREQGRLLAEPDPLLLEPLRPGCFADATRRIPQAARLADYRSRGWSSYLQIGVESFSDPELARLAKGYRVEHIRAVIAALSARRIHTDAYFILSNTDTAAQDLIDSLEELCRLKLRHPRYFHLRFPAVTHLVSYFPSATHRRAARKGTAGRLKLRRTARIPGYPELDYPFVEHDIPQDEWVRSAVGANFLSDGNRYTESLVNLREHWLERHRGLPPPQDQTVGERLLRRLDDAPRRLVFGLLREATQRRREGSQGAADEAHALATAKALLDPPHRWLRAYRRCTQQVAPRLVVIPTWQCQLRCRYCYVPKQDGRVMERATLERAVDMLLGSDHDELILQFFGAEPLVEYGLVQHGLVYGAAQARLRDKRLSFVLSTNGYALDEEKLRWLADYPVKLELSLDGDAVTQNRNRPAAAPQSDSYVSGVASRAEAIAHSGLSHEVIMVVHPNNVQRLADNFAHISALGFSRIQVNIGLGVLWSESELESFAAGLYQIGNGLRAGWQAGDSRTLVNLEHKPLPMRLNGEVTVDFDGTIYGGNGFLHETEHKSRFAVGHLDDLGHFDRYWLDAPDNDYLLRWTYPPEVTQNNLRVGRIYASFLRWMLDHEGGHHGDPDR